MLGLALLSVPCAECRSRGHSITRRSSHVSLRKRLNVNDVITEPGTVELDFGYLYSFTSAFYGLPSTLKFTPAGSSLLTGRTEYSLAFDSVDSAVVSGSRSTQFSDRISFAATSLLFNGTHLNIAVAPQATALLRDNSGMRIGGSAIVRYDRGPHSLGWTASWTGATSPSDSNPAGVWDFVAGYGFKPVTKVTPHAELMFERATGFDRTIGASAGMEYQVTERLAIDVTGLRLGLAGGTPDRQILIGMTLNLGKVR